MAVSQIARIYARLVQKGVKTLEDVPAKIRAEVKACLENE